MTTEDDHEGGEAGAEVLTGTGKHSGGVTALSFASSLETHKIQYITEQICSVSTAPVRFRGKGRAACCMGGRDIPHGNIPGNHGPGT